VEARRCSFDVFVNPPKNCYLLLVWEMRKNLPLHSSSEVESHPFLEETIHQNRYPIPHYYLVCCAFFRFYHALLVGNEDNPCLLHSSSEVESHPFLEEIYHQNRYPILHYYLVCCTFFRLYHAFCLWEMRIILAFCIVHPKSKVTLSLRKYTIRIAIRSPTITSLFVLKSSLVCFL
jgi:hypothetical protein